MKSWPVLLLMLSCLNKDRLERRRDPGYQDARQGDVFWLLRGEESEQLDEAIQFWQDALREHPTSSSLLMRLSRAYTLRGMRNPDPHAEDFLMGREMGLRCMKTEPNVSVLIDTFGRLESRAIEVSSRALCLSWTAMAWSRWMLAHDVAGAGIDLGRVEALAQRAVTLRPNADRGLPRHALGVALALPPEPLGPDLAAAEQALLDAQKVAPDRLQIAVDLAVLVMGPQGRVTEFSAILEDVVAQDITAEPAGYWNAAAKRQAAAALREGPQPRWGL